MPLRVKCGNCGRELVLDEVFEGAYCRCRHCRSLVHVPHKLTGARRQVVRPAHPPFANAANTRKLAGTVKPSASAISSPTGFWGRLWIWRVHAAVATTVLIVTVGVCLTVVHITSPAPLPQVTNVVALAPAVDDTQDAYVPSDDPAVALLTADPLETFFGFPLVGNTIGYVVDGDSTMASIIDPLAYITNTVNDHQSEKGSKRRFGIVMATSREEINVEVIAEPSTDLMGARTVLTSRLPTGQTDLSAALRKTIGWYPDTLFLVLAKPLDDRQIDNLGEIAEQTGAVTNVIGFGEAAKQNLSPLAERTGGKFLPVTDEMLASLVERTKERFQAQVAARGFP